MHYKFKSFRRVAIVGLALLAVPVAQAKPISFSHVANQQGETALGLKADGLRLQAQAQAYADSQEIRSQSLAEMRDAKRLSQSFQFVGSYAKGTTFPQGTTSYPFAMSLATTRDVASTKASAGPTALGLKVDGMRWNGIAAAYQSSAAGTGIQKHYPFANENTAAFQAAEQSANGGSAPVSENSPVVQRLQNESPTAIDRPSGTAGLFGSSLTPASLTTPQSSPAPISENSPIQLRLHPSSPVAVPSSGRGFDWSDAGIGAGIAALLTSMLALGAGSAISRKRVASV